jgi:hypothetical protein
VKERSDCFQYTLRILVWLRPRCPEKEKSTLPLIKVNSTVGHGRLLMSLPFPSVEGKVSEKPVWSRQQANGFLGNPENGGYVLLPETSFESQRTTLHYIPDDRAFHNFTSRTLGPAPRSSHYLMIPLAPFLDSLKRPQAPYQNFIGFLVPYSRWLLQPIESFV